MMPEAASCPTCGQAIPANAPAGLCPICLLRQGFRDEQRAESAPRSDALPSLAELQALFPKLEILDLRGRGSAGTVYRARQPALNRMVALKILRVRPGHPPEFLERFRREAQAMARLNHPNIVAVHDFGEAEGLPYLIMELVAGTDLRRRLADRRPTPREALNITLALCDALQAAHARGIVHRDVKPANILLDEFERVKVADFGLAKLAEDAETGLTTRGEVMGTPFYMAPEQHARTAEADARADLFSVGVILYEMLTGELPVGRFPPPSQKAGTPPALDTVVFKAMASDPAQRYQRAEEFKEAILEVVCKEPLSAWTPGAKRRRRLPVIALAALASAALVLGALVLAAARLRKLPVPRDVVAFGDHYYKVFIANVSWAEAQRQCKRMGGQLAIVDSPTENEFLAGISRSHVWLGATRDPRRGTWAWSDGTPLGYTNWEPGEPNHVAGKEDRLMMTKYGTWNDFAEDSRIIDGYICEWEQAAHPGPLRAANSEALHAALLIENPEYDGRGNFTFSNGVVTEAILTGPGIQHLSALKGLPLARLDLSWTHVTDLSPLQGMPLTTLDLTRGHVSDLAPLAGLPLTELRLEGAPVHDLTPLRGAPLTYLDIGHTLVTDLAPLQGLPLEELHMNRARVRDLAPLAGMPLRRIGMLDTLVEDLSPLERCRRLQQADVPLTATNLTSLAALPDLRWLNGRPEPPAAARRPQTGQ